MLTAEHRPGPGKATQADANGYGFTWFRCGTYSKLGGTTSNTGIVTTGTVVDSCCCRCGCAGPGITRLCESSNVPADIFGSAVAELAAAGPTTTEGAADDTCVGAGPAAAATAASAADNALHLSPSRASTQVQAPRSRSAAQPFRTIHQRPQLGLSHWIQSTYRRGGPAECMHG